MQRKPVRLQDCIRKGVPTTKVQHKKIADHTSWEIPTELDQGNYV